MKNIIIGSSVCVVLLFAGGYVYFVMNPPLQASPASSANDGHIQLLTVGNTSPIGTIEIEGVFVNGGHAPDTAQIQVSDHAKGFLVSDEVKEEAGREYTFEDVSNVTLQADTDPVKQLEQVNQGEEEEDITIYALSIGHEEPLDRVTIFYRHFGIPHEIGVPLP
ncbi:hypothetical protein SAMN05192534_1037 [Alteribacillus persepolensis]|uniref:Uncharacterized protein n=1 Tax=Alteribacillus persepolensis TaxID=568899 RepID=A0A1G8ATF5_9BACI|nr:hypothetical protein [Alteribacillus persepolensis]SDH24093.1 hypothetical protein SAMN05192534_1037 [Alteribacillus persepolensis]